MMTANNQSQTVKLQISLYNTLYTLPKNGDVTEPAKILCTKSVGCGFVARSKLEPAITAIQLSYLKLNSYKQTSSA